MTIRSALLAGVIGPVIFVAVFLVGGATRNGYDPLRLAVSYLSLGDGGSIQVASFVVSGLLIIWFAVGLRRLLGDADAGGATSVPVAVGTAGTGLAIAGLFPTVPAFGFPPGTPDGFPANPPTLAYLHLLGAILFFGGMAAACLAFARAARSHGSATWAAYSIVSAVVVVAMFAASSADPKGHPFVPDVAGLLQRLSIVAGLAWMVLLAVRLLRRAEV